MTFPKKRIINVVVAPLVLVAAVILSVLLVYSGKSPPIKSPQVAVAKVAFMESLPRDIRSEVHTFGKTENYLSTSIASQVGGEIIALSPSFETGLSVSKGDWLVEINPADYKAALADRRSSLANARQLLAEEITRSRLAEEDWTTSGRKLSEASEFTLRKPQLRAAQASVEAAKAAVEKAAFDLKRTKIYAPFDAIIEKRIASPGDIVTPGAVLGSLLAREKIQVRLPLTPRQASLLKIPRFGSKESALSAQLTTPAIENVSWKALIKRTDPVIDSRNQTIYLIGEIANPFDDPEAFLSVGAFVNATIQGRLLEDVHVLPEAVVVDDAFVWVIDLDNKLARQPVNVLGNQDRELIVRVDDSVAPLPLRVAVRPLVSFSAGQVVEPVEADEQK